MPHPESDRLRHAFERCAWLAVRWSGVVFPSASPRYANRYDLLSGAEGGLRGSYTGLGTRRLRAWLGSILGPIGSEEARVEPHHLPRESLAAEFDGDHQCWGIAASRLGIVHICMQIF